MTRRDEHESYRGDVVYEVWRAGGNVDRINDDRVRDNYDAGQDSDYAARVELRAMRPREPEYDQAEEDYYREMELRDHELEGGA